MKEKASSKQRQRERERERIRTHSLTRTTSYAPAVREWPRSSGEEFDNNSGPVLCVCVCVCVCVSARTTRTPRPRLCVYLSLIYAENPKRRSSAASALRPVDFPSRIDRHTKKKCRNQTRKGPPIPVDETKKKKREEIELSVPSQGKLGNTNGTRGASSNQDIGIRFSIR